MCGRFTITVTLEELMTRYLIDDSKIQHLSPNYNVAPMHNIPAVIGSDSGNRLGELRWGLVPVWAKDNKIGNKMINARSETVAEKPAFKRLLKSRRCIIPADGFYEWKKEGSSKQPMRILLSDGGIFSFAGLYDTWEDPEGNKLSTCTIITTEPNSLMADIHNRMPVILRPEDEADWLGRDNDDVQSLLGLLKPYQSSKMRAYPVDPSVGNVRNNSVDLIQEIAQ
ncbi:putative SOS response-associated peptidase YoqW [Paenibacillus albidus]|uniref:Abasic site processing protein n=1 Tax=Paenibacillus albidus TaxID=2041023 RepID=A0A917FY91_9BACL|nr:SOS response-associated peptidase [Paenibacillus albidus]GGG13944.1 putative SOS response-associated peptidase YoqW [Paenibacillus albidus]